ncbi:acyl carrier protein [Kitasatospora sp. NPDC015120]|uniref:acyl carrier protein n=1 Tax=Kitasatospora sp. NPDC015120 TaxID=3364023 RepID=UPI0036F46B03
MRETASDSIVSSVIAALTAELDLDATALPGDAELSLLPGMESVKLLRIVNTLEQVHGVSLDDDALFSIETVDDLIGALTEQVQSAEPAAQESGR